jgi:hypothetical protein
VLALLFDTHDHPRGAKTNFTEALKAVLLRDLLSPGALSELAEVYPAYIEKLAGDYVSAGKAKEFPFPLKTSSPLTS